MSGNSFGKLFRITTWGESHGKAVGVVIDGCPSNIDITEDDINKELEKRRPGSSKFVTPRKEDDKVEILSGIFNGKTLGTPISMIIYNKNVKSEHYENIKGVFRPGHADYTYFNKYGIYDWRGGGRASARETAARVAAGAVAKKILNEFNVSVIAYTKEYAGISAKKIDFDFINKNEFYFPDKKQVEKVRFLAEEIKLSGDSVGGIVECVLSGVEAGVGEPVFDKLEAVLSHAILSIGATKGIEFGAGFDVSKMKGSENNDEITAEGFTSNNSGGMLGGISTGQDIIFRVPVKPIPSISKSQRTINTKNEELEIEISGRHDISAIPRIVPVIESMASIAITDLLLQNKLTDINRIK